MTHAAYGAGNRRRHKKVLKLAKGYYGARHKNFRTAIQAVEKAGQYAYRDRRVKKRDFRKIWIQRINAAVRLEGMSYSTFIHGLKLANIEMDRKVLAFLAMNDVPAFSEIVKQSQAALK